MRKLLVSFAIATAATAAVPAAAQYHSRPQAHWQAGPSRQAVGQLLDRLGQVQNRINVSSRRGIISPREANGLNRQAQRIRTQLRRQGRNGLSGREFASLRIEVNQLDQRLRFERRDRDGRRG